MLSCLWDNRFVSSGLDTNLRWWPNTSYGETMTVKELRKTLEGVDGNLDVEIYHPEFAKPGMPDYMYHTSEAAIVPSSPISNTEFVITVGKGFGY